MAVSVSPAMPRNRVIVGDARRSLHRLPPASVDCVITSPPYYLLRDYGVAGQLGLEDDVEAWVDELGLVMRGVARVLKDTGTVWLNLGDSYSRHPRYGAPPKSLLLGPERLALLADGWTIRNKLVWAKTNPMPSSVGDRLSCTWEAVYLLTRRRHYFFDLDAIRIPTVSTPPRRKEPDAEGRAPTGKPEWAGPLAGSNIGLKRLKAAGCVGHPLGKNPGDVWSLAASNFRGQHHAAFNPQLVRRMMLAGCPEWTCSRCGEPWQRPTNAQLGHLAVRGELQASCRCHGGFRSGVVLDPFFGTGSIGIVAEQLGRDWLGIELNPHYARLANERISAARGDPSDVQQAAA